VKIRNQLKRETVDRLAAVAIVLVPLSTYFLGTKASPLNYSLSMIRNELGYRIKFIAWGITTGLLLTFFIIRLYELESFRDRKARRFLMASLIFLVLTVFIPYMEDLWVLSKLHNITAFLFGVSLIASLYLFIQFLADNHKKIYHWSMKRFYLIVGGSVFLYFIFGSTGIFEQYFFLSLSIFLGILRNKLC